MHKFQEKVDLTYEQFFRRVLETKVQLARELEQVLGRKKAFEVIDKAQEKIARNWVKQMKESHSINSFDDFVKVMKKVLSSPMRQHTATLTIQEETPKKLSLCTTECLRAKIFKEMNATDLGYLMFCHQDDKTSRDFHPKIKFERTKNLMGGDDCCDHTYYLEE
ncbi:MAG: L-2-amino-thiazoline-4-carboxylic acid hydrolase [Candidatus Hodarchaeota archaeon]